MRARLLGVPAAPTDEPPDEQQRVSIVVHDLPAGAAPVTVEHRARADDDATANGSEPPAQPASSSRHMFSYDPPGGKSVTIGSWTPAQQEASDVVGLYFQRTEDRATAERWRTELAAGRLPDINNDSR